ncbi:hypothetical protein L3X38_011446 [Prunus dulcis]|uniref:Uncharacterized protein n=1 Tax=Prunus dulcis TaxID=3755 RepID=A0AAD4ZF28_PRUDU|nr:hypothetical protein L3X38_011446 [Prunus dulcis]
MSLRVWSLRSFCLKVVEAHNNIDKKYFSLSEMPYSKHPNSSLVGISASFSCSELSSNRDSCSALWRHFSISSAAALHLLPAPPLYFLILNLRCSALKS